MQTPRSLSPKQVPGPRATRTGLIASCALFVLSLGHLPCGGCPTATVEAKQGSGAAAKVGFTCGDGCNKAFYRALAANGSTKAVADQSYVKSDGTSSSCHQETTDISDSCTVIHVVVDPVTCIATVTTNQYSSGYHRHSVSWSTWDVSYLRYDFSSCEDGTDYPGQPQCTGCGSPGCAKYADSSYTVTGPCGDLFSKLIEYWNCGFGSDTIYQTNTTITTQGNAYCDEYTTETVVGQANQCAENSLNAVASFSGAASAACSFALAPDKSWASVGLARWRLRIEGTSADQTYKIHLVWLTATNGVSWTSEEDLFTAGSDQPVWYYPSAQPGGTLEPAEALICGYSYQKALVSATIEPVSACTPPLATLAAGSGSELPAWSGQAGGCGCSSCGGGPGGTLDTATLLSVDAGPGDHFSSAGSLVLQAGGASPQLGTPGALQFLHDVGLSEPSLLVLKDGLGQLRQVLTASLFIDISPNTAYKYTVRVMKRAAQGQLGTDNFYTWDPNPAYLLKQYTVENPDASPSTYNRVRIRDVTSGTVEWMFTYSSGIAGWTVTLPGNVGSLVLISTNQAANAWTYIRRHLNPSGQVIAEHTQVFTNFSWGPALLSDTVGTGAQARTRTLSYYDPPPFAPDSTHRPIQTVVEADGAWRKVVQYDAQGRVLVELSGIDTGVTDQTSQCRKRVYSYAAQDPSDDAALEPDSPRKVDEYWKDNPVKRTYYIYADNHRVTVECPNPTSPITDTANLVTTTYYSSGTTRVSYQVNPDGTVVVPTTTYNYQGTVVTTDQGEPNPGNPAAVYNGTRTVVVSTSITHAMVSRMVWALSQGVLGPLLASDVYSGFDDLERATRVDHLDGTFETFSYACCGLDTTSDRDGLVTQVQYDLMHRPVGRTILSYAPTLSQTSVLDAAGRPTAMVRSTSNPPGWVSYQRYLTYDTAGRLTSELIMTGGNNSLTTYAESLVSGISLQRVTFRPDGGTVTNLYLPDGSPSSTTGTAVFQVRYDYGVESDAGVQRLYALETKLDANGNPTSEWVKRYQDGLGRTYKVVDAAASGTPTEYYYYNTKGQLVKVVDPDGVTTLYRYDGQGRQVVTAIDLDQDGQVADYDTGVTGKDRVTQTTVVYLASADPGNTRGVDLERRQTIVWTTDNSAATAVVQTTEASTDGLHTWQTAYRDQSTPVVTRTDVAIPTQGNNWTRTVTQTGPDNSTQVTVYQLGRLQSVTRKDATGAQIAGTSYGYDAFGRRTTVTDARNGTTTYGFNSADMVVSVTTPLPGNAQAPQTTSTYYDASLRATAVTQPDGTSVNYEFCPTGLLKRSYGSRTYPVAYTYDYAGRMTTMTNWTTFATSAGARVTTWNYDAYRGWLNSKRYPDAATGNPSSIGPDYTYTAGGRLNTRTWARTGTGGQRIVTTYSYGFDDGVSGNEHGDLVGVVYSYDPQNTPALTYGYDRRGRQTSVTQGSATTTLSFNDANQLLSESYTSGTLAGLTVSSGYDSYLRRGSLSVNTQPTAVNITYGYDAASRLQTVSDGNGDSATYNYLANSPLVRQIGFAQSGTTRMTTTKQFDYLNRLTQISSVPSVSSAVSFSYLYNSANQRIRALLADGSYWLYSYDALGQVVSGKRYWPDATPVAGQQFEYAHDDIGNRTSAKAGGDAGGAGLRVANYAANSLNQYSSRDVPGAVDVMGAALPAETVAVNSQAPYRRQEYFRLELPVSNGSVPVWQSVTVTASGESTVSGNVFVPKTQEQFGYDADGNLTSDGRWTYTWDAENRLVSLVARTSVGPQQLIKFEYDWRGRRIHKQVWNNTGGTGSPAVDVRFVYDGWNLVAILNLQSSILDSFVWGLDLSGSMEGAGGIGGLLQVTYYGTQTTNCFGAYDGNGNVAALVNAADGRSVSQYEYGPFGELLRATGPMVKVNPFRFSTKYEDDETDLLYYGYRYYNPSTGRWISRDPISERGFNLLTGDGSTGALDGSGQYAFVSNDGVDKADPLGLVTFIGCSAEQTNALQAAIDDYCKQAKTKAFACCVGHFNIPKRLAYWCDHTSDLRITCESQDAGRCKGQCGWSLPGGHTVHMCPLGLKPIPGCGPFGCTILHELTHTIGQIGEKWPNRVENCLHDCPNRPE